MSISADAPSKTVPTVMNALAKRAAIQTAGFLILFAAIFLCAGTIRFWQGWLFCLSFWMSTIAIGIYLLKSDPALLKRRMRFGPRAESRPIQRIIVTITFILFVALAVVVALDHRFGWSRLPAVIVVSEESCHPCGFRFFCSGPPPEHIRSIDHHCRSRAARDTRWAIRSGTPSDVWRLSPHLRSATALEKIILSNVTGGSNRPAPKISRTQS